MATYTGARGTAAISNVQRIINMDKAIKLLQPDETPFVTLLQQISKRPTPDPKFLSFEDELEPRFDAINSATGHTAAATTITVDNGAYFAEHDLALVTRTGEMIRVTAVSGANLTVVRGVGSTAAALNDNDELLIAGSAQPEGDRSRPARSSNGVGLTNFTQIFRRPWELTGTALATENITSPHDWDHQAKKVGIEHKRDINRQMYFGRPSEDFSGSQPRRTTGGLLYHITTNVQDAAGALTETELNTFMRTVFRYGSKRKVLLASPLVTSVMNTFPAGKVQVSQAEKQYGVDVTTFTGPFGALRLVTDWELEGSVYGGYGIAVDFDNVRYRYLAGHGMNRDSKVMTNIQAPDADTRKDEWLSECGLQVNLQRTHGLLTGVTG